MEKDFKKMAWNQLTKNYWMVFIVTLIIYGLYTSGLALVGLIVSGPAAVGYSMYLMNNIKDDRNADQLETLFHGFKNSLNTSIIAYLLRIVFVFLWSLLFLIPGIIKALAFSMTDYIIADHPELNATEALDKSQEMMRGHKWRLFCLLFSFFGWFILSLLTFGIGLIFLFPYINTTIAYFYVDLKNEKKDSIDLEF